MNRSSWVIQVFLKLCDKYPYKRDNGWGDTERGLTEERVHEEGSARADRGLTGVPGSKPRNPAQKRSV